MISLGFGTNCGIPRTGPLVAVADKFGMLFHSKPGRGNFIKPTGEHWEKTISNQLGRRSRRAWDQKRKLAGFGKHTGAWKRLIPRGALQKRQPGRVISLQAFGLKSDFALATSRGVDAKYRGHEP